MMQALVVRYKVYITRGSRSGVLTEITLGIRSWTSLVPRLCTSAYLKGNPWPPGTTGTGRFPWESGLNMTKEIIDKILREIIDYEIKIGQDKSGSWVIFSTTPCHTPGERCFIDVIISRVKHLFRSTGTEATEDGEPKKEKKMAKTFFFKKSAGRRENGMEDNGEQCTSDWILTVIPKMFPGIQFLHFMSINTKRWQSYSFVIV